MRDLQIEIAEDGVDELRREIALIKRRERGDALIPDLPTTG